MANEVDTWLKVGNHYRCGCCLKMPTFVDIRDLTTCPHCEHIMRWYETDKGTYPINNRTGEEKDGSQEK